MGHRQLLRLPPWSCIFVGWQRFVYLNEIVRQIALPSFEDEDVRGVILEAEEATRFELGTDLKLNYILSLFNFARLDEQ